MSKTSCIRDIQSRECLQIRKVNLGISIASLTVSTAALIFLLVQPAYLPHYAVEEAPKRPTTFETVCLDCAQLFTESHNLHLNNSKLGQLHNIIKDGHRQCCFEGTDQIGILIGLLTENEQRESTTHKSEKYTATQAVAAHKNFVQATNKDFKFPGDHIYLTFALSELPHEYTNGLTVTRHSLIIPFSGLYYIYCSIRFHQAGNAAQQTNYVTYVHRVSPYNPGGTGVLLKSVHTASHKTAETTFTGGIFLLREGDRIQVCVTISDVIDFRSESTYTGLLLLASRTPRDD